MPNNTVNQPPIFRDLERQKRAAFKQRSSSKPILNLGGPYTRDLEIPIIPSANILKSLNNENLYTISNDILTTIK